MNILLSIILVIICFVLLVFLIGKSLATKPYKGPVSDHFDGKRFFNLGRQSQGLKELRKFVAERKMDKWVENYETDVRSEPIPIPDPHDIQFGFINHSSFLIQHQGINILTDPIWSKRCSPFQFAGPKRMRPPGIKFEDIPKIDIILISHNHYDHLDKNTIKAINKKYDPTYIVPLGMTPIMKKYGCKNVIEMDWWQEQKLKDLKIIATPANHFSSRGIGDRNTSLWCGYIIQSEQKKIFFVGDTGYSETFKTVGEKLGPIDLSFIPIGAFLPEWFMGPIHVNPSEAVQIHFDIQSKKSVAMHFGTFPLADDNPQRSTSLLKEALIQSEISKDSFIIPDEGMVYLES